jgi:hypothetical protein
MTLILCTYTYSLLHGYDNIKCKISLEHTVLDCIRNGCKNVKCYKTGCTVSDYKYNKNSLNLGQYIY